MPPAKSKTTCSQCRARKVRCTGGPDSCSNCDRLNFACSFVPSPASSREAPTPPERKRGSQACTECRAQKSRCSGELPTCASCLKRDRRCVYLDGRRPRPSTNGRASSPGSTASQRHQDRLTVPNGAETVVPTTVVTQSSASEIPQQSSPSVWTSSPSFNSEARGPGQPLPLPPIREQLHLVIDFFRHLHPIPAYSFLNEVSTTQRCLDGVLDEPLLHAICAVTALNLKYAKYYPVFTRSWIRRAEEFIWSQIEKPTIFRAQALMLIVHYHIESGAFQRAYMLSSLAARAAGALRLQYERTDLSPLAQEIRRRLMWCLMLLDGHFSVGLPGSETCSHDYIFLDLPCNEEAFGIDQDCQGNATSSSLDGVSEDGLLSIILRQAMTRRDAMKLKRQVCVLGQPMPQLEGLVMELIRNLQHNQPRAYRLEELNKYSRSRWIVRYLMAMLGWHQCHCDIFRLFLPGYKEAAPEAVISACSPDYVAQARRSCFDHAKCMIEIFRDLESIGSNIMLTPIDIAICGYHASRLIMYFSRSTLLPADHNFTPEFATDQASMVLRLTKRLFPDSSLVSHLIKDLDNLRRLHIAGESEGSRESSIIEDETTGRQPRFSITRKSHQSLGVHSILRRAQFVDDTLDPVTTPGNNSLPKSPAQTQTAMEGVSPQCVGNLSSDFQHTQEADFAGLDPSAIAGSFPAMVEETSHQLMPGELSLSEMDGWNLWGWQPRSSPNSDGDYF